MKKSVAEIAREASTMTDMDAFWALVHGQMELRGVSSLLFGVVPSKRELEHRRMSQSLIWKSSHKKEFFDAFDVDALFDDDRTAEHCIHQAGVMLWHEASNWEDATPEQRRRADIERDLELAVGFSVPSAHFSPGHVGGIGAAMPGVPLREFERLWSQEGRDLVTLCGILDLGMRGEHMGTLVNLSKREAECLTLLAVGLRADRIADKLSVSDKAVEKYVANARRKLKATTRDHAVAKAIMLGLITP